MRARRRVLGLALTATMAVLPLPFASSATVPVSVVSTVAASLGRSLHALPPGSRLVAVTWDSGDAGVRLRWRTALGWSAWTEAEEELAGEPGRRRGTEPVWLPEGALSVELDVAGGARGLELVAIGERSERRMFAQSAAHATSATARTRLGKVVTRAGWQADERMREAPEYSKRVDAIVVHHTVTGNDYTPAEAPAVVRSVYAYHVRSRGYSDIAYNFLVDRYGKIYQGRAGGIEHAVIGSHAMGFNTNTSGISLLGNLETEAPPAPMLDALARTTAFLSDRWAFDARGTLSMVSRGSTRYRKGVRVTVPRVMGHRDVGTTACPGRFTYSQMPRVRRAAFAYLAPIITDVRARPPADGKPASITARLTDRASWTIEVRRRGDKESPVEARREGRSATPALEWTPTMLGGLMVRPGDYDWVIRADDGVHGPSKPVSGTMTVTL